MMKGDNERAKISRREILRGTGCGVAVAGFAAVTLDAEPVKSATETPRDRRAAGYRETEHVRRAYALSRF